MRKTQQNPQFFDGQNQSVKQRPTRGYLGIIDHHDQHDHLNSRLLEASAKHVFLRFGKAGDVEIDLLDQREGLLKNYKVVIAGHISTIARGRVSRYRQNGGVVIRGGNWDNTTAAGVFARNNNWATNGNTNIGARLARHCH